MNRLMSIALAASLAVAGCAKASSSQESHSDQYAEPIELDEGKF